MVLFYPKSKRNISIEKAVGIVELLKKSDISPVAVTVSPTCEQLAQIEGAGFDYIQIHGEMNDEVYSKVHIPVIRAVNINKEGFDLASFKQEIRQNAELEKVYGILLDAGVPGSGKVFDWNGMDELELCGKKLFLAGGLNSHNVELAVEQVKPDVVDVSSGVEYDDTGRIGKDNDKVKDFITNAKNIKTK